MSKIAVLTQSCKYFAAPFLAEALGADLFSLDHSQDNFFRTGTKVGRFDRATRIDCEHLIVIGLRALQAVAKQIERGSYKTAAVIFSDTNCCIYSGWWNKFVKKNNVTVYAMPDLHAYCRAKFIPAFQTFSIPDLGALQKATDRIIICHSPGQKAAFKGTAQITAVINSLQKSYPIDYVVCEKLGWIACLAQKAHADIFIDQLVLGNLSVPQKRFGGKIPYMGAVAKSGLEAMRLGCCVVSGCPEPNTEPYFPPPPVVYSSFKTFAADIEWLITEKTVREDFAMRQHEWAEKYTSPAFAAKHFTRHINEAI